MFRPRQQAAFKTIFAYLKIGFGELKLKSWYFQESNISQLQKFQQIFFLIHIINMKYFLCCHIQENSK